MLRKIIRGLVQRYNKPNGFQYKISNEKLLELCHAESAAEFFREQVNYLVHLVWQPDPTLMKLFFLMKKKKQFRKGKRTETLRDKILKTTDMTKNQFYKAALKPEIGHDCPAGFGHCKLSE